MSVQSWLLPSSQRRTLAELSDDLEPLRSPERSSRMSAFWIMLVLSAVIASAGVLGDSTATVIGAMIVAPLSMPIMGIALGVVKRKDNGSVLLVVAGSATVVLVGVIASYVVPGGFDAHANTQITGRVSPGIVDIVAAMATGMAGAIALARRDVAAVLPGVAIAISLVPPLVVVGVCLGLGDVTYALGALLLFLSNLVALVLCGIVVFAVVGYAGEVERPTQPSWRTRLTLGGLALAVAVPLVANTVLAWVDADWEASAQTVTQNWLDDMPGAEVTGVDLVASRLRIDVRTPGELPPVEPLLRDLSDVLPDQIQIELVSNVGSVVEIGVTGGGR